MAGWLCFFWIFSFILLWIHENDEGFIDSAI